MKKTKITRIMMSLVVLSAIVVAGGETEVWQQNLYQKDWQQVL